MKRNTWLGITSVEYRRRQQCANDASFGKGPEFENLNAFPTEKDRALAASGLCVLRKRGVLIGIR